tara:strand:+ start:128 stop:457 length:330 start_codon:yes stop_codon:yes gene_type:complete
MIDWARVNELQVEIGADDFAEVVEMFLDEANEVAARMDSNMADSEIEAALHFLKGSALNLGFNKLADLCQDGEKRAAGGQAAMVDLTDIISTFHASAKAFAEMAKNHAA